MNIKQIKEVMRLYGKAWENQDSDLILKCLQKEKTAHDRHNDSENERK